MIFETGWISKRPTAVFTAVEFLPGMNSIKENEYINCIND